MGMTCSLHRLTPAELEHLIENPDTIDAALGRGHGPAVREVRPKGFLGFLLRLTPIRITEVDPDAPATVNYVPNPEKEIDLEKSWHGLHFLFTGKSDEGDEPASYLLNGGVDIDDEGLVRALNAEQVKRFDRFVDSLSVDELRRRFNGDRMMELEIYPEIWDRDPADDDTKEWLVAYFEELKPFLRRTAAAGDCLVIETG